jgi:hypothetical protein
LQRPTLDLSEHGRETLVVTDEKYQRTLNGEKRSGSSQSMQVVRYGTSVISPCLDFGGESYKMQFSDDLKTLTLYGLIPGRRIGNGTSFTEVDSKPFCVYARQGDVPRGGPGRSPLLGP